MLVSFEHIAEVQKMGLAEYLESFLLEAVVFFGFDFSF
jgi:hypothetical protein